MREDGLLVLPGAAGALGKTPVTLAYGVAKSSVHHLVKSFADPEQCGLPRGTTTVGIVPSMLDTEANRNAMPNADFSNWTPLDHVSEKIVDWIECREKPVSGSLIKIVTEHGNTKFVNI
ncbi:predicted protein [Naegleria gruberi]|uniref:Predicted protein n=1 Tax=Naegleria gruberi TaxID=5762 RepID=D2VKH0_NAEGR|nr:uncharacterized protein NAEGRDRAFT_69390 [Naegleria gruberi]EFC42688.1 predicted protein [Naegleria gruberi]|eukprot:XP_002675432.1 predicted protein [Naegleria gruberi strain NEG-M]